MRIAWMGAALSLVLGGVGCGSGSDDPTPDGSGGDGSATGRAPLRVEVGAPFPDLPLTPATDAALEIPPAGEGWAAVGLFPRSCAGCPQELPDLVVQAAIWREEGLRFVAVFEATPGELAERATEARVGDLPLAATPVALFPVTRVLDASTYVLVDGTGTVRFVARQEGLLQERLQSLGRQHRVLSGGPDQQEALVREAYPQAAGVEIRSTLDVPWLGLRTLDLGLSPWFAVVVDSSRTPVAVVFPLERDTSCTTCEPMFLLVGVGSRRSLDRVHPIEPVFSLGELQYTAPFFERVRGVRTEGQLAQIPPMLASIRADQVARELLEVALDLAGRIPPEVLAP